MPNPEAVPSRKRFQKVNIEISNVCNLQCSFCPEVERDKQFMEPELFKRVISQVAPLTEQVCFHLMGEPLVHRRLPEYLAVANEFHVPVNLVSNGVLLNQERIEWLLTASALAQINFSLHSYEDNFREKDITPYLNNIFEFTRRSLVVRPEMYVNFRMWNLGDAAESVARNMKILSHIQSAFEVEVPSWLDISRRKSYRLAGRLYLHFDTRFDWPNLKDPVVGDRGFCHGLSHHFGILVDGTVVPCCLDKEAAIPLGNIETTSLNVILSGARARALLKGFRERRLVEELCQKCTYISRFETGSRELVT